MTNGSNEGLLSSAFVFIWVKNDLKSSIIIKNYIFCFDKKFIIAIFVWIIKPPPFEALKDGCSDFLFRVGPAVFWNSFLFICITRLVICSKDPI